MSNPLAQSSSNRAVNVVYIPSSDSEEEDTKVNVLLSSPHCPGPPRSPPSDKARARNHGEDDQRADPPPPKQGICRARDEVDDEQDLDETLPSTRKSRKLRADGAPRKYSVLGAWRPLNSVRTRKTLRYRPRQTHFQERDTYRTLERVRTRQRRIPNPRSRISLLTLSPWQPPTNPTSPSFCATSGSACSWIWSSSRPLAPIQRKMRRR